MSALLTLRQAVKAELATRITDANNVLEHAGALTMDELERIATRHPALIVACLGCPMVQRQGTVVLGDAVMAVFVVTSDTRDLLRDAKAMVIAEQVASVIGLNVFGGTGARAPTDIVLSNLYTKALDMKGLSLWAVRWRQYVEFERVGGAEAADLERVVAVYDVSDTQSASDQVELPTS